MDGVGVVKVKKGVATWSAASPHPTMETSMHLQEIERKRRSNVNRLEFLAVHPMSTMYQALHITLSSETNCKLQGMGFVGVVV